MVAGDDTESRASVEHSERSPSPMSVENSRQSDLTEFATADPARESSPEIEALRYGVEQHADQIDELADVVMTLTNQVQQILDAGGTAAGSVDDGPPADTGDEGPIRGFH